jgi:hypothetical protein
MDGLKSIMKEGRGDPELRLIKPGHEGEEHGHAKGEERCSP